MEELLKHTSAGMVDHIQEVPMFDGEVTFALTALHLAVDGWHHVEVPHAPACTFCSNQGFRSRSCVYELLDSSATRAQVPHCVTVRWDVVRLRCATRG